MKSSSEIDFLIRSRALNLLEGMAVTQMETGLKVVWVRCSTCGTEYCEALDVAMALVCCNAGFSCIGCDEDAKRSLPFGWSLSEMGRRAAAGSLLGLVYLA